MPEKDISIFLESINYMMWEWNHHHKDNRTVLFDYIIIPNDVDYDFTKVQFSDFITFLSEEKSTIIEIIDIKDIEIIEKN